MSAPPSASPLEPLLRRRIAASGPIPLAEFMEIALYHPDHGYYSSARAAPGRTGDFFTSVSVGPLFGQFLAEQIADLWCALGQPDPFTIAEQGAHSGQLAADLLGHLARRHPDLHAATRYTLIEPAPKLHALQESTLAPLRNPRVTWSGSLADTPPFVGVHLSNELIDAFPVHLLERTGAGWRELLVAATPEGFRFAAARPPPPPVADELAAIDPGLLETVPAGHRIEVRPAAAEWIREVASRLERGFVLAFDYALSTEELLAPERRNGTLASYRAHRRQPDPLADPGLQDLTAHVNHTALERAARAAGLDPCGFTDQHHFLVALAPRLFADTDTLSPAEQRRRRQFATLAHPGLLGRAFKAFAFGRGAPNGYVPAGFRKAPPIDP